MSEAVVTFARSANKTDRICDILARSMFYFYSREYGARKMCPTVEEKYPVLNCGSVFCPAFLWGALKISALTRINNKSAVR